MWTLGHPGPGDPEENWNSFLMPEDLQLLVLLPELSDVFRVSAAETFWDSPLALLPPP